MNIKIICMCGSLFLTLSLILPQTGQSGDSRDYSSEQSSKYSGESSDSNSDSSPVSTSSSIQSNCRTIDASGALVPGVWVPQNNMTISGAAQGDRPEIEKIENYRDIYGM